MNSLRLWLSRGVVFAYMFCLASGDVVVDGARMIVECRQPQREPTVCVKRGVWRAGQDPAHPAPTPQVPMCEVSAHATAAARVVCDTQESTPQVRAGVHPVSRSR